MEHGAAVPVAASGALLWLVHSLLRSFGWASVNTTDTSASAPSDAAAPDVRGLAGDVNLRPQVLFRVGSGAEVAVRALSVGETLFVHFVSGSKSLRLPLRVSEYVKEAEARSAQDDAVEPDHRRRRVRVGGWHCNRETLAWRLQRNVLPEFATREAAVGAAAAPTAAQDAELSRLSDSLVRRVGRFLRGDEFVRLAQTSKARTLVVAGLHRLHDDRELWESYLRAEFPDATMNGVDHPKTLFISSWHRRRSRQPPMRWAPRLPGWPDDRFGPPRGPFSWVPPSLRPPLVFPRRPPPPNWPFRDAQVWPPDVGGFMDDDDDDMRPVFEPRYSWLMG